VNLVLQSIASTAQLRGLLLEPLIPSDFAVAATLESVLASAREVESAEDLLFDDVLPFTVAMRC